MMKYHSGPFHLGLADAQPSHAILRDHHAPARAGRARTGALDRSWPATHDSRVPDDRGQTRSGLSTPHRHSFVADQTPRCCGAAILTCAQISCHPRWHAPLEATKRLVGTIVVVLSATLVLIPISLSNIVPALVIALISLAYLEEDGVLSLDRLAGRRHCVGGRDGGSLADGRRRKMDHRSLVATCRW